MSWLKYPIKNNSDHVLESGLGLWTSSNGVVSFRPNLSGTWFSIIVACCTARYQNYFPDCLSVINALFIWIKLQHVRSADLFEYWRPAGAAVMLELEPFDIIHQREFSPINFLSKSE